MDVPDEPLEVEQQAGPCEHLLPISDPESRVAIRNPQSEIRNREYCPQCGSVLEPRQCKLICECGYFMSCSDF